jgi:hypothetical protein
LTVETAEGTATRRLSERGVVNELRDTFGIDVPADAMLEVPSG